MRNDAIGLNSRYTRTCTHLNSFVSQPGENLVEPDDDNSSHSESVEQLDLEPTQSESVDN